jgi:tape measure domain-containing protein
MAGNSILELKYDLKDLLTPKIVAANLIADKGINNLSNSVAQMSTKFSYASASASNSIAGIGHAADRSLSKIDRLKNSMGHLNGIGLGMGGMLAGGVLTGALAFGGLGVVKAGAQAQQDLIGLSTFVGDKKASSIYQQIQLDAAATPFDTKSLLAVDKALISAGVDADKARKDMLGLANAISATGGGNAELARMATNMQQIKVANIATAMDIKQFAYAGINIYQLLADATGKPIAKTKDMTVTYDLLSFALNKAATSTGLYHDAMQKQSESIFGKWSTLVDDVGISAAKIGMSLAPEITKIIDQWIGYANGLPDLAEKWKPAIIDIVKGLGTFANALIDTTKWIYENWTWIKYAAGATLVFVGAIKAANLALGIYNGLAAVSAARTALFGGASTVAGAAMARTAVSTGWATTATEVFGFTAATATGQVAGLGAASTGLFAGISTGAIAATAGIAGLVLGLGYLNGAFDKVKTAGLGKTVGLDGHGYVNPLVGGNMVTDTTQRHWIYDKGQSGVNGSGHYEFVKTFIPKDDGIIKGMGSPSWLFDSAKSNAVDSFNQFKDLGKLGQDSSDAITGGGKKSIEIHFHKGAVQQNFNQIKDLATAHKMSIDEFIMMCLRGFESVKASM